MIQALLLAVSASPTPCKVRYQDTTVLKEAPPEYPASARSAVHDLRQVSVRVSVDANGKVVSSTVVQSSGNAALDASATKAARASTYAPKIVNCVPVNGGLYLFKVTFDPNG